MSKYDYTINFARGEEFLRWWRTTIRMRSGMRCPAMGMRCYDQFAQMANY